MGKNTKNIKRYNSNKKITKKNTTKLLRKNVIRKNI